LFALALAAGLSPGLRAQWPAYQAAGIPKTPDGKVDLKAPVPRTADGKPNLSGVWETVPCADCAPPVIDGLTPTPAQGRGGAATPPADTAANPASADGANRQPATGGSEQPAAANRANPPKAAGGGNRPPAGRGRGRGQRPRSVFGDIGANLPDGAPYLPWAADLVKKRVADNSKDNPDAHCLPMGIAQMNAHPYPRKIIQTPAEVIIIYEGSGTTVREIFTDGRPLPNKDEVDPWWDGYSVGHWDGDTLVVETTGFMDDGWLDVRGSPLTSAGKLTERFHRLNFGYLQLDETIDDPKAYSKPFTATIYNRIVPDMQLIEFVCIDKDAQHYIGGAAKK
jgi:hypothetical protein